MTLMPQAQSDGPADIVVVFDDQDPWHCGSVSRPDEVTVLSEVPLRPPLHNDHTDRGTRGAVTFPLWHRLIAIIWDHQIDLPCMRHDSDHPHLPPAAPRPFAAPATDGGPPVAGDGRAAGDGTC